MTAAGSADQFALLENKNEQAQGTISDFESTDLNQSQGPDDAPVCANFDNSNPFEYCQDCVEGFESKKQIQRIVRLKQETDASTEANPPCKSFFYFSGSKSGLEYNQGGVRNMQRGGQQQSSSQAEYNLSPWPFQKGYTVAIKFKIPSIQ